MTWDLAAAYLRTGLDESAANDALLTATMAASVALVEKWLNRMISFAEDTEAFPMAYVPTTITLRRYPLTNIISVTKRTDQMVLPLGAEGLGTNYGGRYVAESETGLLFFPNPISTNELIVRYEGGYETYPADLELALWLVFDQIYPSVAGESGGGGGSLGAVSSITIPDVGTVRFATDSGTGSTSAIAEGSNPNIPDSAMAMLWPYRREYA